MVSQHAFCFIIQYQGKPASECWLQEMNLEEIAAKYPGQDVRRVDIMIGENDCWGMGIGSAAIGLLTEFAFISQGIDLIFIFRESLTTTPEA